jgi:hypothetical protein
MTFEIMSTPKTCNVHGLNRESFPEDGVTSKIVKPLVQKNDDVEITEREKFDNSEQELIWERGKVGFWRIVISFFLLGFSLL